MSEEKKDCSNCAHKNQSFFNNPCISCFKSGSEKPWYWMPEKSEALEEQAQALIPDPISIRDCKTCANAVTEKGCRSCNTFDLWEEAQDLSTYEVSLQCKKILRLKAHSTFGARNLIETYLLEIKEIKS